MYIILFNGSLNINTDDNVILFTENTRSVLYSNI